MGRVWGLPLVLGVALVVAPPAAARPPTVPQAQHAATAAARTPGTYNKPDEIFHAQRWRARPGFCNRQWWAPRVVNCWVYVDFPDWPGCTIADKWRVRRIGGLIDAKRLDRYTSSSVTCPGFGTYGTS